MQCVDFLGQLCNWRQVFHGRKLALTDVAHQVLTIQHLIIVSKLLEDVPQMLVRATKVAVTRTMPVMREKEEYVHWDVELLLEHSKEVKSICCTKVLRAAITPDKQFRHIGETAATAERQNCCLHKVPRLLVLVFVHALSQAVNILMKTFPMLVFPKQCENKISKTVRIALLHLMLAKIHYHKKLSTLQSLTHVPELVLLMVVHGHMIFQICDLCC